MASEPPRLAAIEAFRSLSSEEHRELELRLEPIPIAGGDCLVREGEAAMALFLVVSGRFEVLAAGRAAPIAEIGAGSPIGEIAFFAGGPRTATVKAQRDSLVLRLSREDFEDLAARFPQMWTSIAATLARRLAATTLGIRSRPVPRPRTIAVCHAGATPLAPGFGEALRSVFDSHARPEHQHGS